MALRNYRGVTYGFGQEFAPHAALGFGFSDHALVFGITDVAAASAGIAKGLFAIFLVLGALVLGVLAARRI